MDQETILEVVNQTVSGGDNVETVSGGDNIDTTPTIYILNMASDDPVETAGPQTEETAYTLFDKPLEEYTPAEGLLLIIAVLAVIVCIWHIIKEGFSWLSW